MCVACGETFVCIHIEVLFPQPNVKTRETKLK